MSGSSEEKERDDIQHAVSKPSDQTLNLFQPRGVSHPENWQCIYYIAPTNEKKNWKASDRIGIYCSVCKKTITNSSKNSKAYERHMRSVHQDLIHEYKTKSTKKRTSLSKIEPFLRKDVKKMKLASNEVQKRFNRIVASWTSSSLRPFSISEDKELQDLIDFAQSTPGKLKLPSRQTNAREIDLLADEIRGKIMKSPM